MMIYKTGQHVKYYESSDNDTAYGKITRVNDYHYSIKDSYGIMREVKDADIIKRVHFPFTFYSVPIIIMSAGFALFVIIYISHSQIEIPKESAWDICYRQAVILFDEFNDTVGASYAHQDQPSKEVQNFIEKCIENKTQL